MMKRFDDIDLSERDRLAIAAAAAVLRERFPVDRVVLFGSKARGEADHESDIDLLVLTTRSMTWEEQSRITEALYPLQLEHDVIFSPMIVSVDEWSTGLYHVLPIRKEVDRDGVAA